MQTTAATRLRLDAQHTSLVADAAPELVLAVGVRRIADEVFRHDPPTPLEMEQAIDAVEDALTRSRERHAERGELVTSDPLLTVWVTAGSVPTGRTTLTRDEVEGLFDRLASAALGHPRALADLPRGRDAAAALLILRECMHHLGYTSIAAVESA